MTPRGTRSPRRGLWWRPSIAIATLIFAATTIAVAAQEQPGIVTGKLLVATDSMPDRRFRETVIYMFQHGPEGAQGLVLNRPLYEAPLTDLLTDLGLAGRDSAGTIGLRTGGPVDLDAIYVLHSADYARPRTLLVDLEIAVTAGGEPLRDVANGKGPERFVVFVGLAGWGPGQLEGELTTGAWAIVPTQPAFVFDDDIETLWQRAFDQIGIDL